EFGLTAYAIRVLSGGLIVAPFIAGRDSYDDRRLRLVWYVTIVINAVVGIAIGTRSKALIPCVLFATGWISALPPRRRRVLTICGVLAIVPLVQLAGAVGIVRSEMGRDRPEFAQPDH